MSRRSWVRGLVGAILAAVMAGGTAAAVAEASSQVGQPANGRWIYLTAGGDNTCALDQDRRVYCWGSNLSNQINDRSNYSQSRPQLVNNMTWRTVRTGYETICGIQVDRTGWCWGNNGFGKGGYGETDGTPPRPGTPRQVAGGLRWKQLVPGQSSTCGVTVDGELYCWGSDEDGQLGDGDAERDPSAVPKRIGWRSDWTWTTVGRYHACAVTRSGEGYCWGGNERGQVGTGVEPAGETDPELRAPSRVVGTWRTMTAGWDYSCGLTVRGVTKCWGWDQKPFGTTGVIVTPTPHRLRSSSTVLGTAVLGYATTCAIRHSDGKVLCAGRNMGMYGNGRKGGTPGPAPGAGNRAGWTQVAAGWEHVCALSRSGVAYCWGGNFWGAVGTDAPYQEKYQSPQRVPGPA